jgi:hypothetical protein
MAAPIDGNGDPLQGGIPYYVSGGLFNSFVFHPSITAFSVVQTGHTGNFASLENGFLKESLIPTFTGDFCVTAGTNIGTVCQIQGYPVSNAAPANGQTLQFNGTSWVPGDIPAGGNGGGGLVYYFNEKIAADLPTGNLPTSYSGTYELGRTGVINQASFETPNLPQATYSGVVGFITDVLDPQVTSIPAGLFDFNIWASSNTATQTIIKLEVYKYDGATTTASLLASSDDVYTYDGTVIAQYILSVVLPQTTISLTDRLYIRILAKALGNNRKITLYFGGNTPSHVHTTIPSVGGSGLVKVINGVYQSSASLLTNSDVANDAAISASKIQAGVFTLNSETGNFVTTGQTGVFVSAAQTGIFETSGYARNCFVNTGQTGSFNYIKCPTSPTAGYVLCYDGGSWIASTAAGGGGVVPTYYVCENMPCTFILNGSGNSISGVSGLSGACFNQILGGRNNYISGSGACYNTILGGTGNLISGTLLQGVSIVGGAKNQIRVGCYSFIGGGQCNINFECYTFVGGGFCNCATCCFGVVVGGCCNLAGRNSFVGAGYVNRVSSETSAIVGGQNNTMGGAAGGSFIGAGANNVFGNNAHCSFIGAGAYNNAAVFSFGFIGAGSFNTSCGGDGSFIGAGTLNRSCHASCSFVGAGCQNLISGTNAGNVCTSAIIGGANNTITGSGVANIFILGSGITGTQSNTTYVNNFNALGHLQINSISESICVCNTGSSGLINFDVLNYPTLYYTKNSSGDFYINLRGSSSCSFNCLIELNKLLDIKLMNKNGASNYHLTGINIDGSVQTINWLTGVEPNGNANAIDVYSITAIKTGNQLYNVLAASCYYKQ